MQYDLIIKGGTLVDPSQGVHEPKDIAIRNGIVEQVGGDLSSARAEFVVDATGRVVTPGLIDLHVHVFEGVTHYGIEPDKTCLAKGATTVVDAGSAGADNFPGFRKYVIQVSETRIFAQLNISSQGMATKEIGELMNPDYANVAKACAMIEKNRDLILGVKVRLTKNSIVSKAGGFGVMHRTREAADAAGLPIMVHPQDAWCQSIDDILELMREGDILTHCYHAKPCGILDENRKVRSSVLEAIGRGVIFDVGHGAGSFSWDIVESALEQGVQPTTISSDLHVYNLHGPVFDLATCVTKFLHLGFSLDEAIRKVTAVPAEVVHLGGKIGTLAKGAWADAVVFDLEEGQFDLIDSDGVERKGTRKLKPVSVIKGGRVVA